MVFVVVFYIFIPLDFSSIGVVVDLIETFNCNNRIMKTAYSLILCFLSLTALPQQPCPCVKAAVIGKITHADAHSNNRVVAMDDLEIKRGETIELKALKWTGKVTWYGNNKALEVATISPFITTEYTVKSSLENCPDAFDKVIIRVIDGDDVLGKVTVSPNPVNDFLRVSSNDKKIDYLGILNAHGNVVVERNYSGKNSTETLYVSSINSGFYVLHIRLDGHVVVLKKLIKI